MRVAVIGVGYVGLPTALLLARAGHDVLAVDIDARVVAELTAGRVHHEPIALQPLLDEEAVRSRLRAVTAPEPCDVFLIAVPTPVDASGRAADLSMVEAAAQSIAPCLRAGNLVIVESTVPPGTCQDVVATILSEGSGLDVPGDVHLAHAPERVFPEDMLREIVENQRIVGGLDTASTAAAVDFYGGFVHGRIHETDACTAELAKLLENTYRDVNIALANEIATLAGGFGVDPFVAINLANCHPRVSILEPGIGVGGHCIPVDPWFLLAGQEGRARLIPTARTVNDAVPERVASRILDATSVAAPRIVLLGASYKPGIGDTRGSPALEVAHHLRVGGATVTHLDPLAAGFADTDLVEAATGADTVAVLVPHRQLIDELESRRDEIRAAMRNPVILQIRELI